MVLTPRDTIDAALICTMAAGVLAGMLAEESYIPFVTLATIGLACYLVYGRGAPRPVAGHAMLAACMLLAVAAYVDIRQVIAAPNAYGVLCMAGALAALTATFRWALSRAPPVLHV